MTVTTAPAPGASPTSPRYEWVSIAFLALTPLVGIVGTALDTLHVGFAPWMLSSARELRRGAGRLLIAVPQGS